MPIVSSTAVFTFSRVPDLAQRIERAMSDAVRSCGQQGIRDPAIIRQKMLEARDSVKEQIEERDDLAVTGHGRPKKP